jgi:tripartite-type tricarboxylate transporter receptor subunit TctC
MKKFLAAVFAASALLGAHAQTDDWPQKTVRIIVPYGPGSQPDAMARTVADRLAKNTGKPFIVDNKPGAAGMLGADITAKAAADGYTLLATPSGPLSTNALLYKKMPYNPLKDLVPVALLAETPIVLVVAPQMKARNLSELMAEMAAPGARLAYGSSGNGTQGHLSMAYLVNRTGADIPHIPYAGSPQIVTALIAGDIQIAAMPPLTVIPQIKAGKLRAIAAIGPTRHFMLPDLPTAKEQGVDLDVPGFVGIAATAGTPKPVIDRINTELAKALKSPDVVDAIHAQGMEVSGKGPADFRVYLENETKRWAPVIEKNKIVLD